MTEQANNLAQPVDVLGHLASMALHHGEEWELIHDAVAELVEKARLWDTVRQYASGEDFDRWEAMAHGGHVASNEGNVYADERAAALGGAK